MWLGTQRYFSPVVQTNTGEGGSRGTITSNKPASLLLSHGTHGGLDLAFPELPRWCPSRQQQNIIFLYSGFTNPRHLFSDFARKRQNFMCLWIFLNLHPLRKWSILYFPTFIFLLLLRLQPCFPWKLICSASRVTRGLGSKVKKITQTLGLSHNTSKCTYHIEHTGSQTQICTHSKDKTIINIAETQKVRTSFSASTHSCGWNIW